MIMVRYTPHHRVLAAYVALVLVFVSPGASHPIGTSQLARTGHIGDAEARGIQATIGNEEKIRGTHRLQAEHKLQPIQLRSTSERLSQRDPSSDESIVSILVPIAPTSDYLPHSHHHDNPSTEKQDISTLKSSIVPQRLKNYGEFFNSQKNDRKELLDPDAEPVSSSTLEISPTPYISLFSYQISFPFLKYAPKCLPHFSVPGIFTTVVVLLALVWVAILTIALVELGNYMWKERRDATIVLETENVASNSMSSECEDEKILSRVMTVLGPDGIEDCTTSLK
ncbi:hypothetical protein F1880_006333 [Penicillium rolfsii]|nr:hypothetical protein F1880_006333 [Penicillium rolfsii]